jgi:uncharacterized protein (DUF1697 family)
LRRRIRAAALTILPRSVDACAMTPRVALLRAVNLGGKTSVPMAELRATATGLGFAEVRTLLQSGNLVFEADRSDDAGLEALLERAFAERFGFSTDILVRTADEWADLVAANPFPEMAADDPGHLVLFALKEEPPEEKVAALRAAIRGPEFLEARGRHLFVGYPDGIGRSKLTNAAIERKLGTRGTGRNWNTVLKLLEAVKG